MFWHFRWTSEGQGCASNGHCNICLVVSWAWPHSHFVSPLKYFHLFFCSLLHATPVHNLLRHIHAVHALVCPFAKLSSRLTAQLCDAKFCPCCHSLHPRTLSRKSAGRTELMKHSLFKRLSAVTWPCREWAAFVSCFFFSTLAHKSLMMTGGAIPAGRYSSSTLVGLRHPVIDLQALCSSGSSLKACGDLPSLRRTAPMPFFLIVLVLQPPLEFDNFYRRLFRVATLNFVLCMCCL